jgi:uncharacterized membrane protein
MKMAKWLTFILCGQEVAIACCYLHSREWVKAAYWFVAAAMCAMVPFM